jgi:hypothetical protein
MALQYPLMPDRNDTESGSERAGDIFGKLPSERPGVRSPRRRADSKKTERQPSKSSPARASGTQRAPDSRARPRSPHAEPTTSRPPARPPSPRAAAPPSASREAQGPGTGGSGIQDVAWAGITVAAEAATLGVRLLGRAVEAARRPIERP